MLHVREPRDGYRQCLSDRERRLLADIGAAAMPAGRVFPAADGAVVASVENFLARSHPAIRQSYRALIAGIDSAALLRHRRSFSRLADADRLALLESWRHGGPARRFGLRAVLTPLKLAHFNNPAFYRAIGCVWEREAPAEISQPRYMQERAHAGAELDGDLDLDADVVVIGSGAGGAVAARELAEGGLAVVVLEEGGYYDRRHFTGQPMPMQRLLYRDMGATFAIGNTGIPIPLGRTVGGSTTINSGTCFRVPARVLARWRDDFGLTDFTEDALAPHFARVEEVIGVAEADARYLGGVARVIARGCDRLGYRHAPLRRNAPACDGKGVCCFGCPTEAKRSTNVSYVPLALKAGAELFHGVKVHRVLVEHGRAAGVVARSPGGHSVTVRARAVVVSCGSLLTPVLLADNGLCGGSGQLGRNLSIHPATMAYGVFDEDISGYNSVPQGYSIDHFHDEGLLFEGGSMPLDMGMGAIPQIGPQLVELAERFDRVAMFGFMIEDTSRGRVRSVRGRPFITYVMNDHDVARMKRGMEILARVFLAAGARHVLPFLPGFEQVRTEADLARLRAARFQARDFEMTAYHPLGTARMGVDPRSSVVGPDHQAHDVRGLYVVDGAAVPSSVAVNPQVTIMAMATRAAGLIGRALA